MNKKQFILDNISRISSSQQDEIIDIIKENKIEYMQNNYGIFLSLNKVTDEIIVTIYEHIKFCLEHKKESKVENNFEKDNLKHLNDYFEKQKDLKIKTEKTIKKKIISESNNSNIKIELTDMQKDIVMLSKQLNID